MASTYTSSNGLEKPGNGEQSGSWGDTVNTNSDLIDEAMDGQVTVNLASPGTSGSPASFAIADGATAAARHRYVEFTDGGDLGADAFVQLTPNDAEKIYYVRNSLSANRLLNLFQGTYNAGRTAVVRSGETKIIRCNGGGATATCSVVGELATELGSIVSQDSNDVSITGGTITGVTFTSGTVTVTGGTITGITDLAIADGGTGASTAAAARANLGLAIGTDVQGYDVNLSQIAALTPTLDSFIVGNGTAWIAETPALARASLSVPGLTTTNVFTNTQVAPSFQVRNDANPAYDMRNATGTVHALMYLNRGGASVDRPGYITWNLYDPDGSDARVVGRLEDTIAKGGTLGSAQSVVTREYGDARYAQLGAANTFSGVQEFTSSPEIVSTAPYLVIKETDQPANGGGWQAGGNGGDLIFATRNDDDTFGSTIAKVDRDGGVSGTTSLITRASGDARYVLQSGLGVDISDLALGGVGTYAFARNINNADIAFGSTASGSALRTTSASERVTAFSGSFDFADGGALAGTWRCMGYFDYQNGNAYGATLWQRIE